MRRLVVGLLLGLLAAPLAGAEDYPFPERVRVLPVFFVPSDQPAPSELLKKNLMRHLTWSQDRYRELLGTTFELAKAQPDVVRGRWPLMAYRVRVEMIADVFSELLDHYGVNRFTCPFVFAALFVNPVENHPPGGACPLNGGFNRGAGGLVMSSWGLDKQISFQSTLQHELGHAFGLSHVNVYDYSMASNDSIMSYNLAHHTKGFRPSGTPGGLIPEDRRALARNQRVFPGLTFDPKRDVPGWYRLARLISMGGLPKLADQATYVHDPKQRGKPGVGYELFHDGERVGHEPTWSRRQGMANLRWNLEKHPKRQVEARHEGVRLHADDRGYELFVGGRRVGHEPEWSVEQAAANLRFNREKRPDGQVEGRFDGARLLWADPSGYELFFDGKRVGHEPGWTREQGQGNLRHNRGVYGGQKLVQARFNGAALN